MSRRRVLVLILSWFLFGLLIGAVITRPSPVPPDVLDKGTVIKRLAEAREIH